MANETTGRRDENRPVGANWRRDEKSKKNANSEHYVQLSQSWCYMRPTTDEHSGQITGRRDTDHIQLSATSSGMFRNAKKTDTN